MAIRKIIWAELALSTVIAVPAFAQSQTAAPAAAASGTAAAAAPVAASGTTATADKNVKQIKTFEVTGSLIRQADKTGFNQVQVVSQQQIQESGAQSVADYMRTLSANSANSWGESTSDSFAAGGSGIALRGLSEKYTLVLVDGQRVAPYAFAVNGTDQFFDLNTLPLNDIDRIEVVKTGAVSQYGSDAIAGVVNIITKHDYQGLELDGSYGGATQGGAGTTKFSVLGGFGNLTSDGYNITATASYYKDNGISLADRDTTENQNFTGYGYGGNIQTPNYLLNSETGIATPLGCSTSKSVPASSSYIVNEAGAVSGGNVCLHNTANDVSLAPETERYNVKVHGDFKINDTTTAYADLWESNNNTVTNDGQTTYGDGLVYNPGTKSVDIYTPTVSATNPYNSTGTAEEVFGSLPSVVSMKTLANYWRAATGVKGTFETGNEDWDWNVAYTHSMSTVSDSESGEVNPVALAAVLADGSLNIANPSATPAAVDRVLTTATSLGISKLDAVDATLSTPNLFHLPTGDVGLGLGSQFLHESEMIEQGGNTMDGEVLAPNLQSVDGERNVAAVYYQVDVPLINKILTFSQSGRYDHYSDFGGAFSPRFALRFQPVQMLTTYASYNRGFRAPEFLENSASTNLGISPVGPDGAEEDVVTKGNTNLQPERTKNYNIGFELSPTRTTDVGFDWYKIHVDNAIGTEIDPNGTVYNADGSIAYMTDEYENVGSFDTDGFEATFSQALPTKYGTFKFSADWAYVWHFKMNGVGGLASTVDGAGNDLTLDQPFGGSFPRWKGTTDLTWNFHKFNADLQWQYVGPYSDALGLNYSTASYSTFNLNVSYSGFKHWTIYGGINNIFDKAPPYDPLWIGDLDMTGYDQSLYEYTGRYLQIGATYKF